MPEANQGYRKWLKYIRSKYGKFFLPSSVYIVLVKRKQNIGRYLRTLFRKLKKLVISKSLVTKQRQPKTKAKFTKSSVNSYGKSELELRVEELSRKLSELQNQDLRIQEYNKKAGMMKLLLSLSKIKSPAVTPIKSPPGSTSSVKQPKSSQPDTTSKELSFE